MHAFSIVFSWLFASFSQFQHILENTADMQGSLQNAWFWKGGKWQQDVQQHAEIVIDFSTENDPKMNKVRLKITVAAKIAKKRFFRRKFLQKIGFGTNFGSLWGSIVIPGWNRKASKKRLCWDLLPGGVSWEPQGAPRTDFWDHFRVIWNHIGASGNHFPIILRIKIAGKKRQAEAIAASSNKQWQTAANSSK